MGDLTFIIIKEQVAIPRTQHGHDDSQTPLIPSYEIADDIRLHPVPRAPAYRSQQL